MRHRTSVIALVCTIISCFDASSDWSASAGGGSWVSVGGSDAPLGTGADILIMMDVTGSMSSAISAAKLKTRDVITRASEDHPGTDLRTAFIAYRDTSGDKHQPTAISHFEIIDFRENDRLDEVIDVINRQRASGGGDAPEDVRGALWQAYGRSWRAQGTKMIIHVRIGRLLYMPLL